METDRFRNLPAPGMVRVLRKDGIRHNGKGSSPSDFRMFLSEEIRRNMTEGNSLVIFFRICLFTDI